MSKIRIGNYNSEEMDMNTNEIKDKLNSSNKLIEFNNNIVKLKEYNIRENIIPKK